MNSIGLFDSGVGGVTVVRHLIDRLCHEDIIYLADNLRMPYGERSVEDLIAISIENGRLLEDLGCKILIVACNTASAVALEALQEALLIPVIGVIASTAKRAAMATRNGRIGLIATPRTIDSGAYLEEVKKWNPHAKLFSLKAPTMASMIEKNELTPPLFNERIAPYLLPLKENSIDTLILGSTHYPIIASTFQQFFGQDVLLVDSGVGCIDSIVEELTIRDQLSKGKGTLQFILTGENYPFLEIASRLLSTNPFSLLELPSKKR